jgi:ribonuclease BN (tRNA processing enzyme)
MVTAQSEVRLVPLGVGEAFTATHYTSCIALGAGDAWILIDCPHPVRKMLREGALAAGLTLDLGQILGVALTHLHADHCSGLEDFGFYSHFALQRRATVLAHPSVLERIWNNLLAAGMGELWLDPEGPPVLRQLDDYFEVIPLDTTQAVPFGPFSVECRRTLHPVPTTAFRISACGRTVGFSADTAFDPALIAWLEPCDLVVHEVTTLPASLVHTPYADLAALPASMRARMRLIHYPDSFDLESSAIEPLREGRIYAV